MATLKIELCGKCLENKGLRKEQKWKRKLCIGKEDETPCLKGSVAVKGCNGRCYECATLATCQGYQKVCGNKVASLNQVLCRSCLFDADIWKEKKCKWPGCEDTVKSSFDVCYGHGGYKKCTACLAEGYQTQVCRSYNLGNLCSTCFISKYPDHELSLGFQTKRKELETKALLNDHFPTIFGHCNTIVAFNQDGVLKRRFPDFYVRIGNTHIIIEVDENAHTQYDKDDERDRNRFFREALKGHLIFIRFNPDTKTIDKKNRDRVLVDTIRQKIEEAETSARDENSACAEFVYLFYPKKVPVFVEKFTNGGRRERGAKIDSLLRIKFFGKNADKKI